MTMSGEWQTVRADNNQTFDTYVARGARENGHAIVLLQEIFGVNDALRDTAHMFAEQGYLTSVPDLFWRLQPHVDLNYDKPSVKAAFSYLERFDAHLAVKDIAATVSHLRALSPHARFVHLFGFCLGGNLAVLGAAAIDVTSAISFYGVGIEKNLDALKSATCPRQLHFGGKDPFVSTAVVAAVQEAAAGTNVEIHIYPDASHGFFSRTRPGYDAAPAELGWNRAQEFMRDAESV